MTDNFLVHCGQKTRITLTRKAIRKRICLICGQRFRTEEILTVWLGHSNRRKLKGCPVTRGKLERMLDEYEDLPALARELGATIEQLTGWLRGYDL